ncbi:MAG: SGNH/GDSL hydrolase family protein [Propionibacteriaceae bacterium]|jgi:lysophospholipase L1-like esterase|nr:SGNH/GDSL hydrolase family protein [Propionibacteriaceae bacterium]
MGIALTSDDRVLFFGDSITEAGRNRDNDAILGNGYVTLIAEALNGLLPGIDCLNRGVSGDGVLDLARRFQSDCLAPKPTVVSLMIGVNDIWMGLELGVGATAARYEAELNTMLARLTEHGIRLVLMEPYLVATDQYLLTWRADLDARIHVIRRLAEKYATVLVPTDAAMNSQPDTTEDGVHPTELGHRLLAAAWLEAVAPGSNAR